jgi:AAHS family 4-hydroxybenzoate transporter-like MFS transporter
MLATSIDSHSSPPLATTSRSKMAVVICFLVTLIDGYDTLMLAFVAPLISKHFSMPPGSFGKLFSAGYAGAAIGALCVGTAADRWGRKRMMIVSLLIAGIFTLLCAWADSPTELMVLRFLAGIGLGGAIPCAAALTGDHVAAERRTQTVARMFLGFPIGAIAGGALTAAVMPLVGWRGVFIGGGVVALLMVLVATVIPPAPLEPQAPGDHGHRKPLALLFAEGRALGASLICLAAFLMLMVTYFLVSWVPTVLTLNGVDAQRAALAGVMVNVGAVVGALGMSYLILGRNPFPRVAACMAAGALLIPVFGFSVGGGVALSFILVFCVGLLLIGGQQNFPALCVHFFPPAVRATGVGTAMACGRVGSIVGPVIGGMLVGAHLPWTELFVIAALPALAAGIALAFVKKPDERV